MSVMDGQGTKVREQIWLSQHVREALIEYTRRHNNRFDTSSQAADHLLKRALTTPVDEGMEGIIAPYLRPLVEQSVSRSMAAIKKDLLHGIEQAVRETTRRETEDAMAKYTKALGNRVAALLVNAGKDAHTAVQLCLTLLEYDLEDKERVKAYHEEAQVAAGKRYNRHGLDRTHNGETS